MDATVVYRGLRQPPRPFRMMFENDPHLPGSVDRGIWESMVRLEAATAKPLHEGFAPTRTAYGPGMRPGLDALIRNIGRANFAAEAWVSAIARFAASLAPTPPRPLDRLMFGGAEEEVVARGSDWCADVARVACTLLQAAGVPARLVILRDVNRPYSGHTIVEAWRAGQRGAIDALFNLVYRTGRPITTGELMLHPEQLDAYPRPGWSPAAQRGQYTWAAVANYPLGPLEAYDYRTGAINKYYRTILTMAGQGWPGGLRWSFGEDHTHAAGVGALRVHAPPADAVSGPAVGPGGCRKKGHIRHPGRPDLRGVVWGSGKAALDVSAPAGVFAPSGRSAGSRSDGSSSQPRSAATWSNGTASGAAT
jgi:hypothetical protein